jgi:hypothetical protein
MGLHAFFVYNNAGVCLFNYTRNTIINQDLVCGFSKAFQDFFVEITDKDSIDELITKKGLLFKYSTIKSYNLKEIFEFKFNNDWNKYFIDLIKFKNKGFKQAENYSFNYNSEKLHDKVYDIEFFTVHDKEDKDIMMDSCNKVDFYFNKFYGLIKEELSVFYNMIENGKVGFVCDEFTTKVINLFYDYSEHIDEKPKGKKPSLSNISEFSNDMKKQIENLNNIINKKNPATRILVSNLFWSWIFLINYVV